jgi:hypothetical protein
LESGYSVVNNLPAGYSADYDFFLFGQQRHLALQSPDWIHFYLLRKANQKIMAQVAFHLSDHVARSPLRAPFGSFLFSDHLAPQTLYDFVHQVERQLQKLGISLIALTEPPNNYREAGDLLHTILLNQGYRIASAELSSGIRIDKLTFDEKIETWEKRKLKQAKAKGVTFKLFGFHDLPEVYAFIRKCREQRHHTLSMSFDELEQTAKEFKNDFVFSGAFLNREMIAGSIAIRVHRHILYNFYSGHLKKYDTLSPMVTLLAGLYRYCERQHISLLDLGTSALHGQPNFSLLEFKLRLGAVPSIKMSFEKQLPA